MAMIVVLALTTAVVTAVRSTWSPCGLSMLSTVTPLAEAGRGRRWSTTALWFVAGSVLGGLTLGLGMAVLAAGVGALGLSTAVVLGVAAVVATVCAASDLDPFGWHLPFHGRQVNERWLDQYRAWVYGGGFGWQIGVGVATYITTAGIYLMVVLVALTGSPGLAVAVGAGFGLVRGLAIYAGRSVTGPDRLLAVHRRFGALRQPVRVVCIATMAVVGAAAATAASGPVAGLVALVVVGAAAGVARRAVRPVEPAAPGAAPAPVVGAGRTPG